MVTRIGTAAIKAARDIKSGFSGYCLAFVRTAFGVAAKYGSARTAWNATKYKHKGDRNPPAGVPVWFDLGSGKNKDLDHVAITVGTGGKIRSTSFGGTGIIGETTIAGLEKAWANVGCKYLGWSEDINDIRVYTPPKKDPTPSPAPTTGTAAVRTWQTRQNTYGEAGLLVDGIKGTYSKAWEAWVKTAQKALNNYNGVKGKVIADGDYGPKFREQVRTVQSRNGLVADGVLGNITAAWMRKQGSNIPNRPKTRP